MDDRYGYCSFVGVSHADSRIVTDLLWLNHFALMVCGGSDVVTHRFDVQESRHRVVVEWQHPQRALQEGAYEG